MFVYLFLPPAFVFKSLLRTELQGNGTNPSRTSSVISCRRWCSSNILQDTIQAINVSANHKYNQGRHLYQTRRINNQLTVTSGGGGEGGASSESHQWTFWGYFHPFLWRVCVNGYFKASRDVLLTSPGGYCAER